MLLQLELRESLTNQNDSKIMKTFVGFNEEVLAEDDSPYKHPNDN